MHGVPPTPVGIDAVARRTLTTLVEWPGVCRAGLALTEGGGRRLRFTASNRQGETVEWCHIDAFDDVPLTAVIRHGRPVIGTLAELRASYPEFVANQAGTPAVALIVVPLTDAGAVIGGLVVYLDDADQLSHHLPATVSALATGAAAELVRAQRRQPTDDQGPTDAADVPDLVVPFRVDGAPEVGRARQQLRELLHAQHVEEETIDDAVICLSEILTNAVIHTRAPARVRVGREGDLLHVAVYDQGSPLGDRPGPVDVEDPLRVHGRGLQIVDALATRWGSQPQAAGTTAWFELEIARGR